jgi:polyphosphate kinase
LRAINRFAASLVADKQACWRDIRAKLADAGIHILGSKDLPAAERSWLQRLFMTHIFPILTPIAVDPAHPFPFILNKGLVIAVEMQRGSDGKAMNGLIPISGQLTGSFVSAVPI